MKEVNLSEHRADVERLLNYLPWLESKEGSSVSRIYDGDGSQKTSLSFPVYETMLMNFVNEASKTSLMDKNYAYAYSGYSIRTVEDEKEAIEAATVKDAEVLCGILSKYVMGGMTKGVLWNQAVENGVFLAILRKMKKLLDIWDAPLA